MLFSRLLVLGLVLVAPILGGPPTVDITGVWAFTFRYESATVQFRQDVFNLSGQLLFSGSTAPIAFTGQMSSFSGNGANFRATDANGNTIFAYTAYIDPDGNSMSVTGTSGNGIGKRLAGLGPPVILGVRNAASGVIGAVAPGEIISIFGSAAANPIGPQVGVGLQIDSGGKVATAASGVRVLFLPTGVYAPITYAGAGQINAVVPYEIAGLSATQVQIEYLGVTSSAFPLNVAAAAPGIFSLNGSGVGQGAILNHDGTVNGPTNPERRGGVVVLYMTGEGQTTPPGISGKVTVFSGTIPITPEPLAPVQVWINGQQATVSFKGEAPGLVSGVMQLNVQVPTTVSPGSIPIQVVFAGLGSQEGVTVAVE